MRPPPPPSSCACCVQRRAILDSTLRLGVLGGWAAIVAVGRCTADEHAVRLYACVRPYIWHQRRCFCGLRGASMPPPCGRGNIAEPAAAADAHRTALAVSAAEHTSARCPSRAACVTRALRAQVSAAVAVMARAEDAPARPLGGCEGPPHRNPRRRRVCLRRQAPPASVHDVRGRRPCDAAPRHTCRADARAHSRRLPAPRRSA